MDDGQLPEVFTKDDIMKIFGYTNRNVAYTKIKRLIEQNLVEDIDGEENKGNTGMTRNRLIIHQSIIHQSII